MVSFQGSYHSGYPVMGYGQGEIDLHIKLSEVGQKGSWAIAHEMGHNVQWLTGFYHSKFGETTNNLWSMYIYEKVREFFKQITTLCARYVRREDP